MANRHSHKKLRAEIRARMSKSGESYQQAQQNISALRAKRRGVDLIPFRFFGVSMTLATSEGEHVQTIAVLRATTASTTAWPLPLATWLYPRGVN